MWCTQCYASDARGEGLPLPLVPSSALPLVPGHPSVQAPEEGASRSDPGALWLWMVSDAGFTARRQCVDLERLFPVSSSLKWGSWPQLLERLE